MKTITTVVPIGMATSAISEMFTGKPTGAGELNAEAMALDHKGSVLIKSVDKRVGGRSLRDGTDSWSESKAAFDSYGEMLVYRFCLVTKDDNCSEYKPKKF